MCNFAVTHHLTNSNLYSMEQEFEKIFEELYSAGSFQAAENNLAYGMSTADIELYKQVENVMDESFSDTTVTTVTNDAYFFL